ncbi:MAG TPA: hypothetical protein ENJ19_12165 [Gammaproteobacteria bacterium]|nr:hypothetical protein [Gammaproteobacteria bacterium]
MPVRFCILGSLLIPLLVLSGCAHQAGLTEGENPAAAETATGAEAGETVAATEEETPPAEETAAVEVIPMDEESSAEGDLATAEVSGGEGTADTAAEAAPAADTGGAALAEKLLPIPPADVIAAIKRMQHHPRVLWHSASSEYIYYVGGLLNAKYNPASQHLAIFSDPRQGENKLCEYSASGEMLEPQADDAAALTTCNELVGKLNNFLSEE